MNSFVDLTMTPYDRPFTTTQLEVQAQYQHSDTKQLLWFAKVLRKLKLSEPHTRAQQFYKNGFTITKNKPYFVRLVGRLVKQVLLYNPRYVVT